MGGRLPCQVAPGTGGCDRTVSGMRGFRVVALLGPGRRRGGGSEPHPPAARVSLVLVSAVHDQCGRDGCPALSLARGLVFCSVRGSSSDSYFVSGPGLRFYWIISLKAHRKPSEELACPPPGQGLLFRSVS